MCMGATLYMILSVTYYLKLRDAMSSYYCQIDCLDIIEHGQLYLVKNYINN